MVYNDINTYGYIIMNTYGMFAVNSLKVAISIVS